MNEIEWKQIDTGIKLLTKSPYLLIGHSSLLTEFSVFLRGDTLKKVIKDMREGEDLRITVGERNVSFEVVDTYRKYEEKAKK